MAMSLPAARSCGSSYGGLHADFAEFTAPVECDAGFRVYSVQAENGEVTMSSVCLSRSTFSRHSKCDG